MLGKKTENKKTKVPTCMSAGEAFVAATNSVTNW